jgi:hypothetical protein
VAGVAPSWVVVCELAEALSPMVAG